MCDGFVNHLHVLRGRVLQAEFGEAGAFGVYWTKAGPCRAAMPAVSRFELWEPWICVPSTELMKSTACSSSENLMNA